MANRYKGFVSFDFLFSLIPIFLIVSYTIILSSTLETRTAEKLERQILFDKLVSISNYVVKSGAAKTIGTAFPAKKVYPNLISSEDFSQIEQNMKLRLRMKSLHIGFENGEGMCIFRLVVFEPTQQVRKLYFCGE